MQFLKLLLGGLLALSSTVEAKKKDSLRLYVFDTDKCFGPPSGANHDIKRDECVNIRTFKSFKPMALNNGWIDSINEDGLQCWLVPYEHPNCPDGQELESLPLPNFIANCYTSTINVEMDSVKFVCRPPPVHTTIWTTTVPVTTWNMGTDSVPTPHVTSTTSTYSLTYMLRDDSTSESKPDVESPFNLVDDEIEYTDTDSDYTDDEDADTDGCDYSWSDDCDDPDDSWFDQPFSRDDASSADDSSQLQARFVWKLHPWSRTVTCFDCRTKGKIGDHSKFGCRSIDVVANCGLQPQLGEAIAPTHRSTNRASGSWHTRVKFENPWIPGHVMCADAEWEKRGQPNSEIRLQKIGSDMKKCDKAHAPSIDVPEPMTVRSVVTVSTTVLESREFTSSSSSSSTPSSSSAPSPSSMLRMTATLHRDL